MCVGCFSVKKPANYANYRPADGKPAWLEESLPTWHGHDGPLYGLERYDRFVRAYLATLLSVDESVGRLYAALRESNQLDKTLLVFTSDNGFVLGEHGRVDKRTMYEESIRIPLLLRYPPLIGPGIVINQMVLSHDLAPSLLDICGAQELEKISGRSFKPLLQGMTHGWRDSFLYEYNYEKQFPFTPNVRGVRTDDWKLIRYPKGDGTRDSFTAELYDLRKDPFELQNLIADPASAEIRLKLESMLEALSKQAGPDQMPVYEGIVDIMPEY